MNLDAKQFIVKGSSLVSFVGNDIEAVVPEGITEICTGAFDECVFLERVFIPASVLVIRNYAFKGCKSLYEINIASLNKRYYSRDGVVYTNDGLLLVQAPTGRKTIQIEYGTRHIGKGAFACSKIENIDLPQSVSTIGRRAFMNCKSLIKIHIHNGVQTVGAFAFQGCESLENVSLSSSMSLLHNDTFLGCLKLRTLCFPKSIVEINVSGLNDCEMLEEIIVEENNQNYVAINNLLYKKCATGLKLVFVPPATAGTVCLPQNVTQISYNAFCDCKNISTVIIPASVKPKLENRWCFFNCSMLHIESIILPEGFIVMPNTWVSFEDSNVGGISVVVEPKNYEELKHEYLTTLFTKLLQEK